MAVTVSSIDNIVFTPVLMKDCNNVRQQVWSCVPVTALSFGDVVSTPALMKSHHPCQSVLLPKISTGKDCRAKNLVLCANDCIILIKWGWVHTCYDLYLDEKPFPLRPLPTQQEPQKMSALKDCKAASLVLHANLCTLPTIFQSVLTCI